MAEVDPAARDTEPHSSERGSCALAKKPSLSLKQKEHATTQSVQRMSVSQIPCRAQALSAGLVALHDAKFVFDFCGGMCV